MKINVFTPLPDLSTDIANMSAAWLPELAALAEVRVWTAQPEWADWLDDGLDVRQFRPESPPFAELNWADVNVYNIGNNDQFHRDIFDLSRRMPGFNILHDVRLPHFFAAYGARDGRDRAFWLEEMRRAGYRREAESFVVGELPFSAFSDFAPMTDAALRSALAGIVHNFDEYEVLRNQAAAPVFFLPICLSRQPRPVPERSSRRDDRRVARLLVFGFIGSNRRLPEVLRALAATPAPDRYHLDVIGPLEDRDGVMRLVEELGLANQVRLHGFVPTEVLDDALARADLAINLRWPTMGEASGSQLRIWENALPSVVSDVGWYGSLPADAVIHVSPGNESAGLRDVLTALAVDPGRYRPYGRRGRALLERDHLPAAYAQGLLTILGNHQTLSTRYTTLVMARRAGAAVAGIGGLSAQYSALVAQGIADLGAVPDLD